MGLETGTRIADLVPTNPVGATDFVSQGDDHIRLLKVCIQGSFPSLGATAVAATAAELNYLVGVTSGLQAQLNAKQPLDADLTAIAAVSTTPYGISLLTQLDAPAARTTLGVYSTAQIDAGFQPLDADLTAIAALATQSYGRGFLTLADNAALMTKIAAMVGAWTAAHTFGASATIKAVPGTNSSSVTLDVPSATSENLLVWQLNSVTKAYLGLIGVAGNLIDGSVQNDLALRLAGTNLLISADSGTTVQLRLSSAGVTIPRITPSTSTTLVLGQLHNLTGNATLPAMAAGDWLAIVNNSGSAITITEQSGYATYWTALGVSMSTFTIPARGRVVVTGAGSATAYVSGDISAYT